METAKLVDRVVKNVPYFDEVGQKVSGALHQAVLAGGDPARTVADLLHGTWLGHPLHPVLTDIPIGSWSVAAFFDLLSLSGDSEQSAQIADKLAAIGTLAAVPTIVTGLTDYSTVQKPALSTATLHAVLMDLTFTLYLASLWQRKQGNRGLAIFLSTTGFLLMTVGAYVGGHLSYKQKVGVDHSEAGSKPKEWTSVLDEGELKEHAATRVEVEDNPILLYRYGGTVHAIGAVCSHAGGPLEEGKFDGYCVECPWHDSVFDVRDGSIVHGPATYPQPNYQARLHNGKIQVRLAEG